MPGCAPLRRRSTLLVLRWLAPLAAAACSSEPVGSPADEAAAREKIVEAREKFAGRDYDGTINLSEEILETTKDSALKQEALFLAGEAHFAEEDWVDAFRSYQTLLHDYPYSPYAPKCEAPVYAIGVEYLSRKPWPVFHDLFSGRERGAEAMREFAASFPSSSRADDALAAIGAYRYERKQYSEAVTFYADVAKRYPTSEWADLAAYRRAECWQLAARGAAYDTTPLQHAARNYRRYLTERANGGHRDQAATNLKTVDEEIALGELLKAHLYVVRDQELGARIHYANVALAYPETKAAADARKELELHGWDLSINSIDTLALPPSAVPDE